MKNRDEHADARANELIRQAMTRMGLVGASASLPTLLPGAGQVLALVSIPAEIGVQAALLVHLSKEIRKVYELPAADPIEFLESVLADALLRGAGRKAAAHASRGVVQLLSALSIRVTASRVLPVVGTAVSTCSGVMLAKVVGSELHRRARCEARGRSAT